MGMEVHTPKAQPTQIYTSGTGRGYLEPITRELARVASGHHEGYFETFAHQREYLGGTIITEYRKELGMSEKVRIGLLGAGRIGKLHGTNLMNSVPGAEVVMVADPFMNEGMEAWAKSVGISRCTNDPDEVFASSDVDAVFICSSTDTHAEFIIKAARAGKDIFCPPSIISSAHIEK